MISHARIVDRGENNSTYNDLSVAIARDPGAIFFKENTYGRLSARICCTCGFTELYCQNVEELWQAHIEGGQ